MKRLALLLTLTAAAALAVELGCQESGGTEWEPQAGASGGSGFASGGVAGESAASVGATRNTGGASVAGAGGGAGAGETMGGTGAIAGAGGAALAGTPTEANLKVAFVGDTSDGTQWQSVAELIAAEGVAALFVAGDMTYDSDPAGWWAVTEQVFGATFPVFLARGNHDDDSWPDFLPKAQTHLGGAAITPGPHDAAYKQVFRGLSVATIKKGDSGELIKSFFEGDDHLWKVCLWHQNQHVMQLGDKTDEMGWDTYEACRVAGAFVVTGHEHSYSRTKTLTNMQQQAVDPTCADGASLCLGPGRAFANVVGLGGVGIRGQVRCVPSAALAPFPSLNTADASCPMWASTYTSAQSANYGAQFYVFNVDGNPLLARGYFKNVDGITIDEFQILRD